MEESRDMEEERQEEEELQRHQSKAMWVRGVAGVPKKEPATQEEKALIKPNEKE